MKSSLGARLRQTCLGIAAIGGAIILGAASQANAAPIDDIARQLGYTGNGTHAASTATTGNVRTWHNLRMGSHTIAETRLELLPTPAGQPQQFTTVQTGDTESGNTIGSTRFTGHLLAGATIEGAAGPEDLVGEIVIENATFGAGAETGRIAQITMQLVDGGHGQSRVADFSARNIDMNTIQSGDPLHITVASMRASGLNDVMGAIFAAASEGAFGTPTGPATAQLAIIGDESADEKAKMKAVFDLIGAARADVMEITGISATGEDMTIAISSYGIYGLKADKLERMALTGVAISGDFTQPANASGDEDEAADEAKGGPKGGGTVSPPVVAPAIPASPRPAATRPASPPVHFTFALAELSLTGLNTPYITNYVAAIAGDEAAKALKPSQFLTGGPMDGGLSAFRLAGLEGAASGAKFSIDDLHFTQEKNSTGIVTRAILPPATIRFDVDANPAFAWTQQTAAVLNQFIGTSHLWLKLNSEATYNPANDVMTINDVGINFLDMMGINVNGALGGLGPYMSRVTFGEMAQATQAAEHVEATGAATDFAATMRNALPESASTITFNNGVARLSDHGILDHVFTALATQSGQSGAAMREGIASAVAGGIANDATAPQWVKDGGTALGRFIREGGAVELRFAPSRPVAIRPGVSGYDVPTGAVSVRWIDSRAK